MKLGRNKPCHCGSAVKYKKCHLWKDTHPEPVEPPVLTEAQVRRQRKEMAEVMGAIVAMMPRSML